jgi:hypothetical protein
MPILDVTDVAVIEFDEESTVTIPTGSFVWPEGRPLGVDRLKASMDVSGVLPVKCMLRNTRSATPGSDGWFGLQVMVVDEMRTPV